LTGVIERVHSDRMARHAGRTIAQTKHSFDSMVVTRCFFVALTTRYSIVLMVGTTTVVAVVAVYFMAAHSNGQAVIFCSCGIFFFFFLSRLFSAVGD